MLQSHTAPEGGPDEEQFWHHVIPTTPLPVLGAHRVVTSRDATPAWRGADARGRARRTPAPRSRSTRSPSCTPLSRADIFAAVQPETVRELRASNPRNLALALVKVRTVVVPTWRT